jgi:hypothetical protein
VHYEILSPLHSPFVYLVWFLNRGALVWAAVICFQFFRATRRTLWLALAVGVFFLLGLTLINPLKHGLPPLPYAEVSAPVDEPPSTDRLSFSRTVISRTVIPWDASSYILAVALYFAWRQYQTKQISAGT